MEVFGVGPLELMLIFIIALVIMGPQKLPEVARDLGKAVRAFKAQTDELRKVVSLEALSGEPISKPASTTYIPGTQAQNMPDERLVAMERLVYSSGNNGEPISAPEKAVEVPAEPAKTEIEAPIAEREAQLVAN